MEKFDPNKTIEAKWCYDSDTGYKYLLDIKTGKILAKWVKHHKHEFHYNSDASSREMDVYTCVCKKEITEFTDVGGGC